MAISSLLALKFSETLMQKLCDYTNRQYLAVLEDQLRRARLLCEQGKIGEEEYKKLEAELTERIKSLRAQLARAGQRVIDVTL